MGRHDDRDEWLRRVRRLLSPARPLLRRTRPISANWGHERGTPIDRFYIEAFIAAHRDDIRGRVLEIRAPLYSRRYGSAVTHADVLDIDATNPQATIVADLARADTVPAESFDCFILTQTLHYIPDFRAAIGHAHRMLAPGGVLLATVPSIIRVDADVPAEDRWRFTEVSCRELFGEWFAHLEVETGGNVLAAIAFLTGLAAEEISPERLEVTDPGFPVVILVRAVKSGAQAARNTGASSG